MEEEDVCDWCEEKNPAKGLCGSCRKVGYCSKTCQDRAWPRHIFDCTPGQKIPTAYHLARAVYSDRFPEDKQTRIDWGFEKAGDRSEQSKLLGLFRGLLLHCDVRPQTIRQWRKNGILVEGIKTAFEQIPPKSRELYYPWFLYNQHLLDDRIAVETPGLGTVMFNYRVAWKQLRRPASATDIEISAYVDSLPELAQSCFGLYVVILAGAHPGARLDLWREFGFCALTNEAEEIMLAQKYQQLINCCTFEAFVTAFTNSDIPDFFRANGIAPPEGPLFADVMADRLANKSVWDLKQYITATEQTSDPGEKPKVIPSVRVDYGFFNCANEKDTQMLEDTYRRYFTLPNANPLELHQAAIKGRIYPHIVNDMKIKLVPKNVYTRLMKNPYPLREV